LAIVVVSEIRKAIMRRTAGDAASAGESVPSPAAAAA